MAKNTGRGSRAASDPKYRALADLYRLGYPDDPLPPPFAVKPKPSLIRRLLGITDPT